MSNVVSMDRPCDYYVRRAAARRHKGNYAEAMTLLSKAKEKFGPLERIEIEMARVYDEMGCEEEAATSYLRVIRAEGEYRAEALFQLAVSCAQRADLPRAVSYYELFLAGDRGEVSEEYARLLGAQLREEIEQPVSRSKKGRVRALIRRGVERMNAGKTAAARRTFSHARALVDNAKIHTLLACCALMEADAQRAVQHASLAHQKAPSRVQSLIVLADALALAQDDAGAKRALYLAAMRAKNEEEYLAAAIESAKCGEDLLTLRLTKRILRVDPFETRAMMMRACALSNLGRNEEASRVFGRLCVLLPENTVSETCFRMTRAGKSAPERLTLGMDVWHQEGVSRAMQLLAALYMEPADILKDPHQERTLCRLAAWAFRSALAGDQVATVALLLMGMLKSPAAMETLKDALMDPQVSDALKCRILQIMGEGDAFAPCLVDMGGRLVRLAAGAQMEKTLDHDLCRRIVQQAADSLMPAFADAPKKLLDLWLAYLNRYGLPARRSAAACTAALEYVYHAQAGRSVSMKKIARKHFVSVRLCRFYVRRMQRECMA